MHSFSFITCKTQSTSTTDNKLKDVKFRILNEKLYTMYNKATFE